ncbi:hypothetical protein CORC01_08240 [Colletotrichum orchidophilum]|uniref:C3H1-type domain-containing protein n=1 Tax=Colletotrichum orchidophilum TaxID=1209926 RepID=A0A1G4B4Z4_9PEZI|nr:uncharacterized protein CORC01_08240 [Colletotrichum orchidophilum]OHE96477.1 hypothetical protein CORC01_08240 [Colletotrichum orchidophilum]
MNNHYPFGYPSYPGQPPAQQQQPFSYPAAPSFPQHMAAYPQHTDNAFDAISHAQPPYEQSQIMIPGLGGYGHLPQLPQSFGWQQSQEQLPAPPHHWQPPRDGPNLIPASQYYQSGNYPKPQAPVASGALAPTAPKRPTKQTSNDAEEGELSDGELDDVYEPQETLPETSSRQQRRNVPDAAIANARNGNNSVGYPIANSYGGPRDGGVKHPTVADNDERERSGSYSPHLSPHEVNPRMAPNDQQCAPPQAHVPGGQVNQPLATGAGQQQGKNAVEDARQRARSAILNLWPLGVRHQDFIDEGIDKTVVEDLLTDLKLDTNTPSQAYIPGLPATPSLPGLSYAPGRPGSHQAKTSEPALPPKPPAQQQSSPSAVKSAGEERKDRIARLLAAKGAKTASSTTNAGAQAGVQSDKELVQQQKMDALKKSREARAQKAAERKGSLQASQSKEASPVEPSRRPQSATADVPVVVPTNHYTRPNSLQQSADRQTAQASTIPGLFTSAPQPAPVNNQRKRPVAADFVVNSHANKRSFGHTQQDKRFVIDVSDASDDEDIEMEIGSPTDEPSSTQQNDTPSLRPASFRDFPPLSDGLPQRQLSSPAPSSATTPQSGAVGSQPKQAHIDVMDKQIEAMKRKIALAEARAKLKAAMGNQSVGQKSTGQSPDTPLDSDGGKPSMRRVQSMGDSHSSDPPNGQRSPAIAEPSSSLRLPKPSDKRIHGDSSRAQKLRIASTNLPVIENRLQTKKSKLRLLQLQMSRLEKEIEEEMTEKQKLTEEMEQLEQDSDESSEPQNQLKSNSVDPIVTGTSTGPQPKIQTPTPAAADAEQSSGKAAEQSNNAANVRRSKSPAMSLDRDVSNTAYDAQIAVTGKVAMSPSQAPTSTDTPMPHETPSNPETAGDDVESQPITNDDASDVAMAESDDLSSSEQEHENDYEPPENFVPAPAAKSPSTSLIAADSAVSLVNSDTDSQQSSARASQIPEQISLGVNESTPEQGVNAAPPATQSSDEASSSGERFTPYESPLQYFRAYRYHPKFAETVPGGLRSLTYSNRIDPNLPICPDQLASRDCPRGADCIYQHFESMKLPDDQILLQLGGTTLEGPEKAQFNDGLRKLLHEMRSQNIKDFPSIAKGIVDYHNRFTGDPSKILPLGNVSI